MKKTAFIIIASLVFAFGNTGLLMAGHHYHGCSGLMMSDLSSMDTDNDGLVSLEEFTEPHMEKYRGWFTKLDTNGDGYLSQDELEAFRDAHSFGDNYEG